MKIAVSDAPYLKPLVANIDAVCAKYGWSYSIVPEEEAAKMLLNFAVELALVSPIGYGMGVGNVDYRITKGPMVTLHDFTKVAGIRFAENIEEVETIASSRPKSLFATIGALIMREKFEVAASDVLDVSSNPNADCFVELEGPDSDGPAALDIGEEWFDMAETGLPTAMWVNRVEADIDNLEAGIVEMADPDVVVRHVKEVGLEHSETLPRAGRISYRWDDDTETAITAVLNLLFFHQIIPELPEIKLLGRDEL